MSGLSFGEPMRLLLLLLVPLAVWIDLRRPWAGGRGVGIALRAALLGLVGIALAEPQWESPAPGQRGVVILDGSDSLPVAALESAWGEIAAAHEALPPEDQAALVLAGAHPILAVPMGEAWPATRPAHPAPGASALGAALDLARALVPADRPGTVQLWSDGLDTENRLAEAAARLATAGLPLQLHPLSPAVGLAQLVDIELDTPTVAPGATLAGAVHWRPGPATGPLHLLLDGAPLAEIPLSEGAPLPFTAALPPDLAPGLHLLSAELEGDGIEIGLPARAPPRVLLVAADPVEDEALYRVLSAEGLEVERAAPARAPADLAPFDLVILADTPVGGQVAPERPRLAPATLAALGPWVRAGGGLLVLGGPHAYDLGGYEGSLLDPLLPVIAEPPGQEREDAATLVIALDKSASMAARAAAGADPAQDLTSRMLGGNPEGSKIRLVAQAAVAASRRLRDQDQVGILAIDAEARWALPIHPASDHAAVESAILRIKAGGGGIYLLNALEAAQVFLERPTTPLRHLLLFADAADVSQKQAEIAGRTHSALDVVSSLAEAGVTVSVIGIGSESDQDVPYLKELAQRGHGRFHLTADYSQLAELFVAETEQVVSRSLEEEEIRPRLRVGDPAFEGVDLSRAPALLGRNKVTARARARTLVESTTGAPLFVSWRLGLGEVVAVATDAGGRWGKRWRGWSGYARLWTQLARGLARDPAAMPEGLRLAVVGRTVELERREPGGLSGAGPLPDVQLEVDGERRPLSLRLKEPGLWRGPLDLLPGTRFGVEALVGGVPLASVEGVAPPSPERGATAAADLSGLPIGVPRAPARHRLPFGPWVLGLALCLLPLDALLRRGARF